jgi:acetoin utilization protein AcuC
MGAAVKTALIHSDAYKRFDYGPEHPLRMERLGLTFGLMEAYGLTSLPGTEVRPPAPAPEALVREFHDEEYLAVLRAAGAGEPVPEAYRYGLGPGDKPSSLREATSRAPSRSRGVSTTRCRPARRASAI